MNANQILAFLAATLFMPLLNAQTVPDAVTKNERTYEEQEAISLKKHRREELDQEKINNEKKEKFDLMKEVEHINEVLSQNKISADDAKRLKSEAAIAAALNIDNKNAIIENEIQLLERGNYYQFHYSQGKNLSVGIGNTVDDNGSILIGYNYTNDTKKVQYDKRTSSSAFFAGGLGNTIKNLSNSPYKIWKSGYGEIGYLLKSRLLKDSNFLRLNYGFAFQVNNLSLYSNHYFVQTGNQTTTQIFPEDLKAQTLSISTLSFPVHLEFGNSKKKGYYDRFRYDNSDNWKFGIGGQAGFNIGTKQSLRYYENGRKHTDNLTRSYNTSNFVYGVSGYVGYGIFSIFAKYDLNPIFKNNAQDEHLFSLGLRLDL